jgi:hypothetical protein
VKMGTGQVSPHLVPSVAVNWDAPRRCAWDPPLGGGGLCGGKS